MSIATIFELSILVSMKLSFGRFLRFTLIIGFVALVSCGGGPVDEDPAVEWPELVAFDDVAYRAEGFAKVKDRGGLVNLLPKVLETGRAISAQTIPGNVANRQKVEQVLGDLSSLVEGLAENDISDDQLFSLTEGLHPVVAALIESAGMPHIHANEGPNEGSLHPLFGTEGGQAGTAEIKLHDDAGDIEVWLTKGGHGGSTWDLPIDSTLKIDFPDLVKQVTLAVRDAGENRDEAGNVTVRDGATNYFVFPGETGVDASWLMGEEFAAKAELSFEGGSTGRIVLRPHAHHEEE